MSYYYYAFEQSIGGISERAASGWGFRLGERGTHTSRTMMLEELKLLMNATPTQASREDYVHAVVRENCLGKETTSNRELSWRRLRELYGLDPGIELFRIWRVLWERHHDGQALLALLLALARDPLLRATTTSILNTSVEQEFARQSMTDALSEVVGERLNSSTLDKVVRNAASSWTQSGHLKGRGRKFRQRVRTTPAATAYALVLGYVTGQRGALLFDTAWCAVLDASTDELINSATTAKQLGLLDLKQAGSIVDVSFPALLSNASGRLPHGAH